MVSQAQPLRHRREVRPLEDPGESERTHLRGLRHLVGLGAAWEHPCDLEKEKQ